jgi:hypothetical protein
VKAAVFEAEVRAGGIEDELHWVCVRRRAKSVKRKL